MRRYKGSCCFPGWLKKRWVVAFFLLAGSALMCAGCSDSGDASAVPAAGSQDELVEKVPLPDMAPAEPYAVLFEAGVPIVREVNGETTRLYANIFRPDAEGTFPALLEGIAYRREMLQFAQGPMALARNGFVVVFIDVRGTGSAEGTWGSFSEEEINDHVWIIDNWIPEQAWSNGKVGLFGPSYMGINQLLSAGERPEHLKAIFPGVSMADAYRDIFYQGGIFNQEFILFWALTTAGLSVLPSTETLRDPFSALEAFVQHATHVPELLSWLEMTTDQEFFEVRSPMYHWDAIAEYPAIMTGGWFDIFTRGTLLNYENTSRKAADLLAGDSGLVVPKKLIVGPWYHVTGAIMAGVPMVDLHLRWFQWHLQADDDPLYASYDILDPKYPVTLYVLGAEQWRKEPAWPLERAQYETFYLSSATQSQDQSPSLNNGTLLAQTQWQAGAKDQASSVITHDPPDYAGWQSRSSARWLVGATMFLPSAEDERANEEGCLTFSTPPLSEDVEICGRALLRFWARTHFDLLSLQSAKVVSDLKALPGAQFISELIETSTQNDVHWIVNLNDVYPDGRSRNLTSGWLAASHRGDPSRPYHVDPLYDPFDYPENRNPSPPAEGELYEYVVEIWPTCNLFKQGHQIRVSIANSDVPHMLPSLVPSESEIVHDAEHPAQLILPVVDPASTDPGLWIEDPAAYFTGQVSWEE